MNKITFLLIGSLCFLAVGAHDKSSESSESSHSSSSEENDLKLQHKLKKMHNVQRQDNNPAYVPQPLYNLPLGPYPYGGYNPSPMYAQPQPFQYPIPQNWNNPNQYPNPAVYQNQYPVNPSQSSGKSTIDHSLKVNKEYKETGHHDDPNGSSSTLDNHI